MSPGQRKALAALADRKSPALITQGPSTKMLQSLRDENWVRLDDHPTVIDRRTNGPALAIHVTEAGRKALTRGGKAA
jgi:hypothetical protein